MPDAVAGCEAASDPDPEEIESFTREVGARGTGSVVDLKWHIWVGAADDVIEILDALEIPQTAIFERGGSQPAVATAVRLGSLISADILLAPDPPMHLDRSRNDIMGRVKTMIYTSHIVLTALATLLSRKTNSLAIEKMTRANVKGGLRDLAVYDNLIKTASLVKGGRQSARGMIGFACEHEALFGEDAVPRLADATKWSILLGTTNPMFNACDEDEW